MRVWARSVLKKLVTTFKLCCLVTTLNYFTLYQYYVAASDWTAFGPRL